MDTTVSLQINKRSIKVELGITILEAAQQNGIQIPHLCYHPDICVAGNCRVCVVEIEGYKSLQPSCAREVLDGMVIHTNTIRVRNARKTILELLLSEHKSECTICYKNELCELQDLAASFKLTSLDYTDLTTQNAYATDDYSPAIIKDDSKCIRCQRCVRTCAEIQHVGALTAAYRGDKMKISTFFELPLNDVVCTNCGQCINRCPTGALIEKSDIDRTWDALYDQSKHVVVQTAPSVRIGIGESFQHSPGERLTGKMVAALKKIGFDSVLDTNFTADLTIVEEGYELLNRLRKHVHDKHTDVKLPLITSCSPGWIKFAEHRFHDIIPYLSSCKSPQQMFGALAKTYFADRKNIDPENIVSVSIMPCTAKKFEARRPEMQASGFADVDISLTTRELAVMIKQAGIKFDQLEDMQFDSIMGKSTGAGMVFGATGGVMEAALRTAYAVITGKQVPFENLNVTPVRGMTGVKEASILIKGSIPQWDFLEGVTLRVAIAHGLENAYGLIESVLKENKNYHFIEIMACPGGCLGGGGQPLPTSNAIRQKRMQAVYNEDLALDIRESHKNPEVDELYKTYLGKPNGEKSHELLHTQYLKRFKY